MRRLTRALCILALLPAFATSARAQDENGALLDSLQHATFNFFWNEANPSNGLIKDRSTVDSPCSIASVGFGLTSICIGVDRGWVTREDARDRVLRTLRTFYWGPQGTIGDGTIGYKGFFYHFLDMNTGLRTWNSELSTIDTALLLAGVLDAGKYFSGPDSQEVTIRELSDSLYYRADWDTMRQGGPGIRMGWKPGTGFSGFGFWTGYNEAMIMYILALGSPTHPVPASCWSFWTSSYFYSNQFGYTYVNFPPLFGHQYSHCWIDYRGIQDAYMRTKGITYFENSRRASLAQWSYSIVNPGHFFGYSDSLWGLTACDGPQPTGYSARGAPNGFDDGTIAPTAAISSLPFTPNESFGALRKMTGTYGPLLRINYGLRDAFNLGQGWFDTDVIGIDQGPIVIMIENYNYETVWQRFMQIPYIQSGLSRAGFTAATASSEPTPGGSEGTLSLAVGPNPFRGETSVTFRLATETRVRLMAYDARGRVAARLADRVMPAGVQSVRLDGAALPSGVYSIHLQADGGEAWTRCVRLR